MARPGPSPADRDTLRALTAAVERAGGAAVTVRLVAEARGVHASVASRHLTRLASHRLARESYPDERRVECVSHARTWLPVLRNHDASSIAFVGGHVTLRCEFELDGPGHYYDGMSEVIGRAAPAVAEGRYIVTDGQRYLITEVELLEVSARMHAESEVGDG